MLPIIRACWESKFVIPSGAQRSREISYHRDDRRGKLFYLLTDLRSRARLSSRRTPKFLFAPIHALAMLHMSSFGRDDQRGLLRQSLKALLAFFFFSALSVYITYPLVFHMGDMATRNGDELVIAWIQNWVIHIITSGKIVSLFNANLYYPFHNTFAYSEALITSSIISLIPFELSKQPLVVVNITFISSLILLGFSLYLLSFYLTKSFLPSLLSGVLVIFSPDVLDKTAHLQIMAIEWVPLAILFFIVFINTQKTRHLVISLVFFLMQTYNSFLPGYFIVFSYAIIFLYFYFSDKEKAKAIISRKNIALVLFSFLLVVPIAIPYYQVSYEFHYVRDIRDTIHFALQPEDFLYAGSTSRLHSLLLKIPYIKQVSPVGEIKPGFIGFIFTILSLYSLWIFVKNFRKNNTYINLFSIIALTGLLLSLGPALHLNRQTIHKPFPILLPYGLLYYLIPGFKGIRDTERWEMLFIVGIAVVIAMVMQKLLRNYAVSKRMLVYLFLFAGVIAEFKFPLQLYNVPPVNNFPKVYSWLSTTPQDTKIIILPIYNWGMWPHTAQEIWREYFGTIEFRKMVNGYSGFSPPPWQHLVEDLYQNFPRGNTVMTIKKLGINYIIVDKKEYDSLWFEKRTSMSGAEVIDVLQKNPSVRLIKKSGSDYVFAFNR